MDESWVKTEQHGSVAVVTLNRPAKLNALTSSMLQALERVAMRLDEDLSVRTVVLSGAGDRAFCVGADVLEWSALEPLDMWRRWVRDGHRVFDRWARLRPPVVVALNGHAFGGGVELALAGDIRMASRSAQLALPEASIATCPGWSGTQRLVQLVGMSHAKYLALSGVRLSSSQALSMGLVQEVLDSDQLMTRAMALASAMADQAPVALQLTKQLLNAAAGEGTACALESMAGALAATTADAAEGLRSFTEKRRPTYVGR